MPPDPRPTNDDLRITIAYAATSLKATFDDALCNQLTDPRHLRALESWAKRLQTSCKCLADELEYEERKEAAHQQSMSDLAASGGIVDAP